ncbi:acyl-CoA dehydrogenase family protein [Nocardia carnea]|uniref:acyl-CoA dehydrogenase family protein n=1 Tax=Nocardia carnea TaxID=37328 RepID=UPI0024586A47|nr:acyl-CoA dehydrogenase family protein [Nocardia carnea]
MTIATTDEHKAVQQSMSGWAAAAQPIATMRADTTGFWRSYWPTLTELGIFHVAVAEAAGGAGGSVTDLAVFLEQAAHDLVGGPVLTTAVAGLVTGGALAEDQPCGVALDTVAPADSEPGAAVPVLDPAAGTLSGTWESVLGAAAGTALLLPVDTADGRRWCLVPPDAAGVELESLEPLDLAMPLARVRCTGVTAAVFAPAYAVEDLLVALAVAELAGVTGWCLETAVDYAKVREQFGRQIGSFQAVKHICAWMLCRTELIRAVAADAAAAVDSGAAELPIASAIAAAISLDAAVETAKDCIQVLGGIGFTWEHDAHLYLRRAVALSQLLGGGAYWRGRVTELTRAGQRRTTGADRVFADAAAAGSETGAAAGELAGEVARIAALPADRQRTALAEAGLIMPHWPKPYGRAADPMTGLVISEELRRAGVPVPDLTIGGWAVPTLLQHGTPEQIERFAWPTLRGEVVWCQLFSEPGAGSDLAALRTSAERTEGGWILRGQKVWTSLAKEANWAICLARTDPAAPKHKGISYFLVDMRSAGIDIRPLVQITGEARFSEVFLDEVFVPDDCVVGALGNGWKIARSTLSAERVAMSGNGIGPALEELIAKLPATGRGSELINDRLGGFVADAIAGLLLEQRAAVRILAGADPSAQSSVRKLVGVRHRQAVAEFAVQVAGPAGARTTEDTSEFLLTRCLSIAGGTEQILLTVAAERILGLPRDAAG